MVAPFMNISFLKLASDRVALLALKTSFPIENRRSTVALNGMAVLNLVQFHQHWFAQEGDVSQDLLRAALQPGLYQVL